MGNIGDEWHRATAERVGGAVAKARRVAGLSAQALADRCAELGAPIHRVTVTKIENGRARFDLGELLILAQALDVPPMTLVYPDMPDGEVEVLPGVIQTSWEAYRWATGMDDAVDEPTPAARLVRACLERDAMSQGMRDEPNFIGQATVQALQANNSPLLVELEKLALQKRAQLDKIERIIRESGGTLHSNDGGVTRRTSKDGTE